MSSKAPVYTVLSKAIIVDLVKYRNASDVEFQEIHEKKRNLDCPLYGLATSMNTAITTKSCSPSCVGTMLI